MNVLLANLSSFSVAIAHAVDAIRKAYQAKAEAKMDTWEDAVPQSNNEEEVVVMKKSTWIAILVAFAAAVGALVAVCVYLRRREAELDEYEQLLFSEDFSHEESEAQAETTDVEGTEAATEETANTEETDKEAAAE